MLNIKSLFIAFFFISISSITNAQSVQWASKVLGFSSEGDTKKILSPNRADKNQFKAKQVLGRPNKLPAYGLSPVAWAPSTKNNFNGEWIKVGFKNPIKIKQIGIAENSNPGAVSRVAVFDQNGKEYEVYRMPNVTRIGNIGRIFKIDYTSSFKVTAVKVELKTAKVEGWNQIDAIGISSNTNSLEAKINLSDKYDLDQKPENLGSNINSRYQEIAPMISPDGETLYFTRGLHPMNLSSKNDFGRTVYKQDVWFAKKRADGKFDLAKNIGEPVNNKHHNSAFSISPDGNTMLLNNIYNTDLSKTPEKGLSVTRKISNNKWSQPQKINITDFKNNNPYSEFYLSQDGNTLLMTVQRDDSYGSKDIYVSFKSGSQWSKPKNLGPTINTAASEISPFLASDGKTLYYATSGLSGYGSNDIFMSKRLDNSWTNWSEPQNLGPKINSAKSEAYFSIPASADFAYFTSSNNSMGGGDIFRVSLKDKPEAVVLVKGTVYNAKTKKPIAAQIKYSTLEENSPVNKNTSSNPDNGNYKVVLQLGKKYDLHAHAKGFIAIEDSVSTETIKEYKEIVKDLYLMPIEKGVTFELKNIFFARNSYRLLPESFPSLNSLAETMTENESMKILLEGHTEIFGNAKELKRLGLNRVKSVKRYLESKNIDGKRIDIKSFGGTKPVYTGDNDAERGKNRRVEVKIL